MLVRDGLILLSRRYRSGYEDGNYSVPAGHLEGGETVVAAAAREAWEEVGVMIAAEHLNVVGVMHRCANDERVDFFLLATLWSGEISNREPGKCDELRWADPKDLPANTIPYVRRAIGHGWGQIWFDSVGWQ